MFIRKLQNLNFKIIFPVFIYIAILTFIRYQGNYHPAYVDIWNFFRQDSLNLINDLYLSNTVLLSSKLFAVFSYLNINIDHDVVGYVTHLLSSCIGYFFCYKIINSFLEKNKSELAVAITLSLAIFDNILLNGPQSGWISSHSGTQTLYIHALIFPMIWFALKNNWIWVSIISGLAILFSIKVAWFPILACFFYFFFQEKRIDFLKLTWIIFPLICTIYIFSTSQINLITTLDTHYEKSELFKQVINIDLHEDVFHLQNKWLFLAFLFSMILYWILLKSYKINTPHFKFAKVVLLLSLILTILGFIYGIIGSTYFPEPRLILLSPVRSIALYQLFFGILACIAIAKTRLSVITVSGLLASWTYFYMNHTLLPVLLILCLVANSLLKKFSFGRFSKYLKLRNNKNSGMFVLRYYLIIVTPIILVTFVDKAKDFDLDGLKKINQWTAGYKLESELFDHAIKLKACDDFILLPLSVNKYTNHFSEFTEGFYPNPKINLFANKSKYVGTVTNLYLNLDLQKEHYERVGTLKKFILLVIYDKKIPDNIIDKFKEKNLVILSYKFFTNKITKQQGLEKFSLSKNIEAIEFFGHKRNKKISSCINNLKI